MSQHVSEFPSLVRPGSIPFLIDTAFHLSVLPSMASGVAPALAVVHSAAVNTRVWTCKKLCAYARLSEKDSTYSPRESPFTAQTSWCVFGPMRVSDDHSARAVTEAEPLKKKKVRMLCNYLVMSLFRAGRWRVPVLGWRRLVLSSGSPVLFVRSPHCSVGETGSEKPKVTQLFLRQRRLHNWLLLSVSPRQMSADCG